MRTHRLLRKTVQQSSNLCWGQRLNYRQRWSRRKRIGTQKKRAIQRQFSCHCSTLRCHLNGRRQRPRSTFGPLTAANTPSTVFFLRRPSPIITSGHGTRRRILKWSSLGARGSCRLLIASFSAYPTWNLWRGWPSWRPRAHQWEMDPCVSG